MIKDSKNKLATCHPDLIKLVNLLSKEMDVLVACGYRTKEEQNDAFKRGNTKLRWPKSGHNSYPSRAVDLCPYPLDWSDRQGFMNIQDTIRRIAVENGIELKPVITWDLPHVELA